MANCGADTEANALLIALTQDATFPIPNVDLSGDDFKFPPGLLQNSPSPLTPADITTASVDGPGVFDVLMRGFKAHIQKEWDEGRITGDDYTKAYITLTEAAMSQGISFLLGKDQAYWSALSAQVQAFMARVELETTKVKLAAVQYEASNQKANYALTKMQMTNQEMEYCSGKFNLEQILPKQVEKITLENTGQTTANSTADYNLTQMLPQQKANLLLQGEMLSEQTEAQRAQTLDIRKDGQAVVGVLGKQKDLYTQQITSYQRDAELKAARLWSDAWITQKTIDEGLVAPPQFTNTNVDAVLADVRSKNNLG